jgi:hypothetical protein
MNCTVPGAPLGETCTVKVTVCPKREDDGETFKVVVVETCALRTPAQRKTMQTAKTILGITINLSYSPRGAYSNEMQYSTVRE